MLLFSSTLQFDRSLTKDEFIKLVIRWNNTSRYTDAVIPGIIWNGEYNTRFGDDQKWLAIEECSDHNIIAIRYEKKDTDGIVWGTEFVANFNELKMAVRLDRSYMEKAKVKKNYFYTPGFISMMEEQGYLVPDNDLPVSRKPIYIQKDNLELLTNVINGKAHYRLPVVFVSKTLSDKDPVHIGGLANKLKGVAHVLVQNSRHLNYLLRELCAGKNEYNGAIGIYFPNCTAGHQRFLYHIEQGNDAVLFEKVVHSVFQYTNSQLLDTLYTWQGVTYAILRDRLNNQLSQRMAAETACMQAEMAKREAETARKKAESAAAEAGALVDSVDDELHKYQKQIEVLTKEKEVLLYENQGLHSKLSSLEHLPLLYYGDETEFFPGEVKEMVLSALEEKLEKIEPKSRQADVLRDVITKNGGCQHEAEQKAQMLKLLLRGYKMLSASMKQALSDIGFVITEEGRHCKLTYFGDERYWTTLAKTPSDSRTGLNVAMTIIKNML